MPPPACNQQRPGQPGEGTSITPAGNRPHLASGHDLRRKARTTVRRKQERSRLTVWVMLSGLTSCQVTEGERREHATCGDTRGHSGTKDGGWLPLGPGEGQRLLIRRNC